MLTGLSWYFFIGAGSAAVVEVLNLFNTVSSRPEITFRGLLRSPFFWFITIFVIALSGLATFLINHDAMLPNMRQIVISGVGARSLIRLAGFSIVPRPASGGHESSPDSPISFHDLLR